MRAATRNHEDEIRTSVPAIVPEPERARRPLEDSGPEGGSGSDTGRGYPRRVRARFPAKLSVPSPSLGVVSAHEVALRPPGLTDAGSPAERIGTPVDGVDVLGALSPSRAGDFMTCPLLYRFRTDRPAPRAVLARRRARHRGAQGAGGPLRPAGRRAHPRAGPRPAGARLGRAARRRAGDRGDVRRPRARPSATWLASCREVLDRYFTPGGPQPARARRARALRRDAHRLQAAAARLRRPGRRRPRRRDQSGGLQDRQLARRVVRGQGAVPDEVLRPGHLAHPRACCPSMLQLVYLGNGEMLRYVPDEQDLLATERKVEAVWQAIVTARETGDWRPNRSQLCAWCAHQAICPEWGGTPPPLPEQRRRRRTVGLASAGAVRSARSAHTRRGCRGRPGRSPAARRRGAARPGPCSRRPQPTWPRCRSPRSPRTPPAPREQPGRGQVGLRMRACRG